MKYFLFLFVLGSFFLNNVSAQRKSPFNGVLLNLSGSPIKSAHIYVKSPRDYALTNKKGEFRTTK